MLSRLLLTCSAVWRNPELSAEGHHCSSQKVYYHLNSYMESKICYLWTGVCVCLCVLEIEKMVRAVGKWGTWVWSSRQTHSCGYKETPHVMCVCLQLLFRKHCSDTGPVLSPQYSELQSLSLLVFSLSPALSIQIFSHEEFGHWLLCRSAFRHSESYRFPAKLISIEWQLAASHVPPASIFSLYINDQGICSGHTRPFFFICKHKVCIISAKKGFRSPGNGM